MVKTRHFKIGSLITKGFHFLALPSALLSVAYVNRGPIKSHDSAVKSGVAEGKMTISEQERRFFRVKTKREVRVRPLGAKKTELEA